MTAERRALTPMQLALAGLTGVLLSGLITYVAVRPGSGPGPQPQPPLRGTTSPGPIPTDLEEREPLPLGTARPDRFDFPGCPAGFDCRQLAIACPGVHEEARVTLAIAAPEGVARGLVVFFSGGGGRGWWADEGSTGAFLEDIREAGMVAVQVRWKDEWLGAARGERAGPHLLACRSATLIRTIHGDVYAPLGAPEPGPGRCGFCLTGNSGGASQITYAMDVYGLDDLVDVLIPTGGPPHAALAKGCLRDPAFRAYWYEGASVQTIDTSWGFRGGGGPCVTHDPSFTEEWDAASVDLGGRDYTHPATRIHVIVGERDRIAPHAEDYVARLRAGGSPDVTYERVPDMGHSIAGSPDGLDALLRALLG